MKKFLWDCFAYTVKAAAIGFGLLIALYIYTLIGSFLTLGGHLKDLLH